jgi:hypothetical protein
MTEVELKKNSARDLASRLSALQIAYIGSLHSEKEDKKTYKVAEKESRAHDKAETGGEAFDGETILVYDEAETNNNLLEAETLLAHEEFLASISDLNQALQTVDNNHLNHKANKYAYVAADDELSSDDISKANKNVFNGENSVINEGGYSGSIDTYNDTYTVTIGYDVSARPSALQTGKKRPRSNIVDANDDLTKALTLKKPRILVPSDSFKHLGRPKERAKK